MKFTWFHLMPYRFLPEDFKEKYRSVWVDIPRDLYDPKIGHRLYNDYLDQLEFADRRCRLLSVIRHGRLRCLVDVGIMRAHGDRVGSAHERKPLTPDNKCPGEDFGQAWKRSPPFMPATADAGLPYASCEREPLTCRKIIRCRSLTTRPAT